MRRALRIAGWTAAGLVGLVLLAVAVLLGGLNTGPGRQLAEREVRAATGGMVTIAGLAGTFPTAFHVGRIVVADARGPWLTVEDAALEWSPAALLARTLRIDTLSAATIAVDRLPAPGGPPRPSRSTTAPWLPAAVDLRRLHVGRLRLAAAVAGAPATLAIDGHGRLASLTTGTATIAIERLDAPGRLRLDAQVDAAALRATLRAEDPAGGLFGPATGLPGLGPVALAASLDGPWSAVALKLDASAGPLSATAGGTLDVPARSGALDATAHAPAMRLRPDLGWQDVSLEAHVHGPLGAPEATGTLRLDGLEAAGAGVSRLAVEGAGHAGGAQLTATADGVRIPGPRPDLLAAAPLRLTASADLQAPGRPVRFTLSHPLVTLAGTALTGGTLSADATLSLPDLAPLAAAAGADIAGEAALTLHGTATEAVIDGTVGITGGMAPLPALIGGAARIGVTAERDGNTMALSRFALTGATMDLSAHGSLANGVAALDWQLRLADLKAVSPTLAGDLAGQGHVGGRLDDLSATADLAGSLGTQGFPPDPVHGTLSATGLPGHPAGSISADGQLEGQPLTLAATATRGADGALAVRIDRADWRSTHAEGALTLPAGSVVPLGSMTATIGNLADFEPLLGKRLAGSVTAALSTDQQGGTPVAALEVTVRNAGLPGTASVGEARLAARVRDPLANPTAEATLTVSDLSAGTIGGGLTLAASGPANAIGLRLDARLAGVGGADLGLASRATLDGHARTLALASLEASWKAQTLRLLAPAKLSFADGFAVDRLRLGLGGAEFALAGRLSPTLDATASLTNVTADLARIVAPGLAASGRLQAEARLAGTPARPTGTVTLTATALRLLTGDAAGLPAAGLTASATLQGSTARLDAALTAGRNRVALAGTVPIAAGAAIDLRATGQLSLATLNPLLGAGGRQAAGQVSLDATVSGTPAAPRADGTLRLTNGEVQDFAHGARLDNIEAVITATGDTVRITRLTARAGRGTLSGGGTIGIAGPMPVDLTLTANHASPLASDQLTATLDAALTLRGALLGAMQLAGRITITEANIGIPEHIPPSVAVLNVTRPGKPPPPPAPAPDIGLDITITSPGRTFVRGLGIEAEFAGNIHVTGTAAAPRVSGGFQMRQGRVSLAGTSLNFSHGVVGFNGSTVDPTVDFVATSTNASVIATLEISGYARDPKIALSSTPPLSQDEVLSQLLFHQSAASLSPLQLAEIAQAIGQLTGTTGGFNPLGALRSGLGLDRLSVVSGQGGKGTAVEAGRYVAQGVYVGARQGTDGTGTQGTVQIDLAKGLKLQTTVGQSQNATGAATAGQDPGTSVGLTYQFQY